MQDPPRAHRPATHRVVQAEGRSRSPPKERRERNALRGSWMGQTSGCPCVLQWGRRVSAAESGVLISSLHSVCLASMGPPRFSGGKSRFACRWKAPKRLLQWGRRVSAAERSLIRCTTTRSCAGFNGAAAFQRRKAQDQFDCVIRWVKLQWGRRVSAAESCKEVRSELGGDGASMGPPRFSGGKEESVCSWGRQRDRFNGAAAFQRRKGERAWTE